MLLPRATKLATARPTLHATHIGSHLSKERRRPLCACAVSSRRAVASSLLLRQQPSCRMHAHAPPRRARTLRNPLGRLWRHLCVRCSSDGMRLVVWVNVAIKLPYARLSGDNNESHRVGKLLSQMQIQPLYRWKRKRTCSSHSRPHNSNLT